MNVAQASRFASLLGVLVAVIVFASLTSGCAGQMVYEAAVGVNATKYMPWTLASDGGFSGPRDTFRFTARRESSDGRYFCGWNHVSHLSAGPPFNDKQEDWLDMVECGARFDSRNW